MHSACKISSTSNRYSWALILAGGDGARLQDLTRSIAGDVRPKQFCRLFGGKTLLRQLATVSIQFSGATEMCLWLREPTSVSMPMN